MSTQPFDRSSKWLIQHHGDAMLRLAQVGRVVRWRPVQAEVVQPRQLPDGLLEARLQGQTRDDLFLLEVATYPERRAVEQLTRDTLLVYLDRGRLPEAIVLVLAPKGKYRIPERQSLASRLGTSSCEVTWRVVELWNVPADDLLATGDVGLVPWVMLAQSSQPPEQIAQRCRETIEQLATAEERPNLLAVSQVLARLRYTEEKLFTILGGKRVMIESPLIQELVDEVLHERLDEGKQQSILEVLKARFGEVPAELEARIRSVHNTRALTRLTRLSATCRDLDSFAKSLR